MDVYTQTLMQTYVYTNTHIHLHTYTHAHIGICNIYQYSNMSIHSLCTYCAYTPKKPENIAWFVLSHDSLMD